MFKLDLPVALQVYPVFNVSLLWQYIVDRMLLAPLEVDDETEYIIDSIILHQGRPRHY